MSGPRKSRTCLEIQLPMSSETKHGLTPTGRLRIFRWCVIGTFELSQFELIIVLNIPLMRPSCIFKLRLHFSFLLSSMECFWCESLWMPCGNTCVKACCRDGRLVVVVGAIVDRVRCTRCTVCGRRNLPTRARNYNKL